MVGITWRRAAIRELLRAVASVPARRGRPLAELPDLGDAEDVLAEAAPHVPPWHAAVAYWPPQQDRGRAYLHLLDERGKARAFLKLANGSDAGALDRERDALATLAGGSWPLTTPPLLASGETGDTRWLLTGPLPRVGRQTLKTSMKLPHTVIEEIRGEVRTVPLSELDTLSWWSALQHRLPAVSDSFTLDLHDATADGVQVARGHGDFCAHNVVSVDGRVWVFDWEEYAPDAPIDQDVVNFRLVRGDDMAEVHGGPGDPAYRRFVMCCAFGVARDIPRFRTIVDGWPGLRPEVE
jgi:hypothetical protein